ncbi:hypothetical protein [Nocardia abscessus]|uniref:hypothetical protein n=1 Tax=Nocardia abscessus TaxID=120957 RepID=UPI002453957C|nr:hypothetical protein [Nocardia abscessus]
MGIRLHLAVTLNFDRAMEHCDNLVRVHQRAGGEGKGRRREEISVNRAVIVIAIASWQAVVQDITRFLLDEHTPNPSDPNHGVAQLLRGFVLRELDKFSTPNAENTRQLLQAVGFNPRPYWTWPNGAAGSRAVTYKPHDVEGQLRDWLKGRHAIAHGDEKMPEVSVLQAVRDRSASKSTGPTVRLADAKACIKFIRTLTKVTIDGLDAEMTPPNAGTTTVSILPPTSSPAGS